MSEKFTCAVSTKHRVIKGDDDQSLQGAKMARRISRLIERKPDVLQTRPEWGKYKDGEAKMQERAAETREEHRQEKPGVVHEELEQDDGTEKSGDQFVISELAKGKDGHVSSVAVVHKDAVLMGKRRDNNRWTLPGGHLDDGEDPHEGGKRELKEEAGIEADQLHHLKSEKIKTHTGKEKTIHAFKYEVSERPKTSMVLDPDQEVHSWKWIRHKDGKLPEHVSCNLHSPKNTVLTAMGLDKSGAFFITDLIKGMGGHKYIRKYQRAGKWIYIYHEPGHHGRRMDDQHVEDLHALAEHGDEHAKSVVDAIEEGDQNVIDDIIALADHGDEHAKQMMKDFGLKKEKAGEEKDDGLGKLERTVTQSERLDPVDKPLEATMKHKATEAVAKAINEQIAYLNQHRTTPIGQALHPVMMDREFTKPLHEAKTIREMMTAVHTLAAKLETKQGNLVSSNSSLTAHGGTYGNMIHNRAMKALAQAGVIPEAYADEHMREARGNQPEVKSLKDHAERAARAEAERAERERRELGELQGSMAFHMASMMENSRGDRVQQAKQFDEAIKSIFGRSLKKEEWPYNFEAQGLKTKISSIDAGNGRISMDMRVYDSDGNQIMQDWRREWSKQGGRPHIYNSIMVVKSEFRGGAKVGDLINKGQRELMKAQPRGGTVGVTAALDVGGYNWANQGFSFSNQRDLQSFRQRFQLFCQEKGIHLTNEDMEAFTEPVHFAAFNDGKKYIKNVKEYKLTQAQKDSGELAPGHPLSREEKSAGRSNRMACHLGKAFLLGQHWSGIWDSREANATTRYADSYANMRERAVKHLEANYQAVSSAAQAGERTREAPRSERVTPRSSVGQGVNRDNVERHIRSWTPAGDRGNIRMTKTRIQRILRWPPADVDHFLANASLTPAARRAIRAGRTNR